MGEGLVLNPALEREALEAKYRAIAELERRQKAAPLLFYRLMLAKHKAQQRFHELIAVGLRLVLFLGGNRSGKTTAGVQQSLAYVYGYRFWEVPGLKLARNGDLPSRDSIPTQYWTRRHDGIPTRVPSVGMVVSGLPRLRGIGQTIFPKLWEALPAALKLPNITRVLRSSGGCADWMEFPNGSKILFASEEQDDMTFEGFTLDWAWVDEPIRKSIFSALWARLFDFQGPLHLTLTPLEARAAWMYFDLVQHKDEKTGLVFVKMGDNPANTPEMIRDFVARGQFTKRELAARLNGEFEALGNRVIDNFNPGVHICKAFMPPADWIHGLTVDPHHKRPSYMVWWAFNPDSKTYHFYREWPTDNFFAMTDGGKTPAEYATLIRNVEGSQVAPVRICDPRFGKAEHQRHGFHETSWVQLMRQYGLDFDANVPDTGSIDFGVSKIIDLMRYDENFPVSPTNHPKIYIHEGLENMQNALMNWGFAEARSGKDPYTKVNEEFKDPVDAMRYTILYPIPVTAAQARDLQPYADDALAKENDYDQNW
jgi:hypothetical protein